MREWHVPLVNLGDGRRKGFVVEAETAEEAVEAAGEEAVEAAGEECRWKRTIVDLGWADENGLLDGVAP